MSHRHVVLLTYGEPEAPATLAQLRYSWRILIGLTSRVASIPAPVMPIIALSRARFRNRLWTRERYASPLEPLTREQARGLAAALGAGDGETEWRVHVAYEFRDPLLTAVLEGLPEDQPVDVLPMYVADSAFTHQISRDSVARWAAMRRRPRGAPVRVMPPLEGTTFAALSADHVLAEADARAATGPEWALVLAAHGTLLDPPRPIETGRVATEQVAEGIAARLADRFGKVQLGWLNHVYGGRWTEPPVEEALRRVAAAGYRRVVYFPFGFSADNAESQLEGRIALRAQPGLESVHLPCLNAAPAYLEALARQVVGDARTQRASLLAVDVPASTEATMDSASSAG
jgi:protoheme ferro-lyase